MAREVEVMESQLGIDTEYPIAIRNDGSVFIRLYPGTDIYVEVSRQTALHLFSLARRYSDTIRKKSWASFWPRIDQIERSMTVLFMEANDALGIGMMSFDMIPRDVLQSGLADGFRNVASSKRRMTLTEDVEQELVALYQVHVKAKVPVDLVRSIWTQEWPKVVALLQAHHVLEPLLENDRCYDTQHVYEVVRNLLLKHGRHVTQGAGKDDDVMSHEYWCDNDASIFASAIYRHAD